MFTILSINKILINKRVNLCLAFWRQACINYSINAVDTSAIYSDSESINISIPYLPSIANFLTYYNKNGELELSWSQIDVKCSPIIYEIRKGTNNSQAPKKKNSTRKKIKRRKRRSIVSFLEEKPV